MNDRVLDILHRKASKFKSPYSYYVTRNRNTENWDIKEGVEILNEENYLNIVESHLGLKNSIAACVHALEAMGSALLA
jgi:hypothetical protein